MSGNHSEIEHNLPQGIGKPATKALIAAGFTQLAQFTTVTEKEILQLHGVGPKAVGIIVDALSENGLSFSKETN
jgi:hypothetical protein